MVAEAATGREAVEKFKAHRPDITFRGREPIVRRVAILLCLLVSGCGFALNLGLDISQYRHTARKIREGCFKRPASSNSSNPRPVF
jgi:hypothetical protein